MDDPFARAAVEDAVETARLPRVHELAKRRFAVEAPRAWWISPLIIFATVMLSFLAPLDLFQDEDEDSVVAATGQVEQSIEAIVQTIEDQPLLSRELSDLMGDLTRAGTDPDALRSPEEIRREAIREVTELNKALDKLVNGEKGKTAEAIEKALGKLKSPTDGPGKELAESLARADFKAAQESLDKMLEDLKKGNLTQEQQEQLAEQLKAMAEQLQQLAEQQQQLEQALKQAGLDANLAQNPQALQQALQNNQNLNQQQKQQLQQMAQAQQAAQQACQGLGQAMQQMAQGLQQGQLGQMGQGGQQMGDQLNQLEQMQMLLQQAQAAANMCQGQCQGLGQGLSLQQAMAGGAFGNRGQGRGGKAPIAPTPTRTTIVKADTVLQEGDIIARQLFDGPQIRGESDAKLRQVIAEKMKGWEDGLTEDQLPRVYYETQMHYFGELEKLTRAIEENGGDGNGDDSGKAPPPPPDDSPDP
jgi:uncharacterized protein (UPF0335 family)